MKTAYERFFGKVKKLDNGCWEWIGGKAANSGYGVFWLNNRLGVAHRVSYEWANNKIPEGLELDHLCRNKSCVNPDHLEIVTHSENARRGETGFLSGQQQGQKTHCPQGHPYDEKNTYHRSNGWRDCKICRNEAVKRHTKKEKVIVGTN